MTCPTCGAPVADGARFCSSCGHPLASRGDERRIATVLFADLVGFTTLSEARDPEEIKNLVDSCFERLVQEINTFGGKVDKIIGDAILALFGAPVAHEDDAERAVRAALRMQEALRLYCGETGAQIRLRIGVNTGEVLVGSLRAGAEYTAMGDVVNTAQRLQTTARPGSVVVGGATYAATRDVIEYRSLGAVAAKGREEPVDAWEAVATLLPPGYRPRRVQTPFVGRDAELGILGGAIDAAVSRSRAHLVLLLGEAGVGKSRLAAEVAQHACTAHRSLVYEGRCVPYGEANVWWPVAEALRQACAINPDDGATVARDLCTDAVATALQQPIDAPEVRRVVNGLTHLMGYEGPLDEIDAQRAREEAHRSVLAFIEGCPTCTGRTTWCSR
jgi:class 3 adenylate cyclase